MTPRVKIELCKRPWEEETRRPMAIDKKLIDQLLTNYKKPEDIIGENGLLKELTKALLERALEAELSDHLGYEKHDPAGHHRGNTRNGKSPKTLKGDFGELELETPRDRKATFEPRIVAKGQTRWTGFDDKIISMYARGMTTREIQGHLQEIYGIEVSPALISNVTEAVLEEVKVWQNRPLEELYPIVYLDALMVKVRDEGHIQNKAIYVVLGVDLEGQMEVLGLWVAQSAQGDGRRSEGHLSRGDGRGSRAASGSVASEMESLSQREPGVAAQLGTHHAVFPLPAGDPARHLHHQQRG